MHDHGAECVQRCFAADYWIPVACATFPDVHCKGSRCSSIGPAGEGGGAKVNTLRPAGRDCDSFLGRIYWQAETLPDVRECVATIDCIIDQVENKDTTCISIQYTMRNYAVARLLSPYRLHRRLLEIWSVHCVVLASCLLGRGGTIIYYTRWMRKYVGASPRHLVHVGGSGQRGGDTF